MVEGPSEMPPPFVDFFHSFIFLRKKPAASVCIHPFRSVSSAQGVNCDLFLYLGLILGYVEALLLLGSRKDGARQKIQRVWQAKTGQNSTSPFFLSRARTDKT
jgi:hypothetical protein